MANNDIPQEYYGWWQIIDTSQWAEEFIDILGAALISFTGYNDRLRMFALLAHVNCRPTKTGVSFTWRGAWEYDPVSGTGSVKAAPGVGPREIFDISQNTIKLSLENGAILPFLKAKRAFF